MCRDGTARDDCRLASRQLARVGGGSAHMMHSQCGGNAHCRGRELLTTRVA